MDGCYGKDFFSLCESILAGNIVFGAALPRLLCVSVLTPDDYGRVVIFWTSVLLFCSNKQMSFFVNKGHASRNELPINNLSQQLGKFRKEKSKPNTGSSTPALITTKQKSQNQG